MSEKCDAAVCTLCSATIDAATINESIQYILFVSTNH